MSIKLSHYKEEQGIQMSYTLQTLPEKNNEKKFLDSRVQMKYAHP